MIIEVRKQNVFWYTGLYFWADDWWLSQKGMLKIDLGSSERLWTHKYVFILLLKSTKVIATSVVAWEMEDI